VLAIAGFVLPVALGFALGYWGFGLSLLVSLFIGGSLTSNSIGMRVRVWSDLKRPMAIPDKRVNTARVCFLEKRKELIYERVTDRG